MKDKLTINRVVSTETQTSDRVNARLCAGILKIMRENWRSRTDGFDAWWYGYESLKDCLFEEGIYNVTILELKKAMKELSNQGKVELLPSYDFDFKLCGRGWYACT